MAGRNRLIQGQGPCTEGKQNGIHSALAITMKIVTASSSKNQWKRKFKYWHFDANAGSGWNDFIGVRGSPLVFHQAADEHLRFNQRAAFFCDTNKDALLKLHERLSSNRSHVVSSRFWGEDNETGLIRFARTIAAEEQRVEYSLGTVLVDCNGYWYRNKKGEGPPIQSLTRFTKQFLSIDLVLNLNVSSYRRNISAPLVGYNPPLDEVMASLNKKYWLVKKNNMGTNKFVMLVGRNLSTRGHKTAGWFGAETAEGKEIIAWAENQPNTKVEQQLELVESGS